MAKDETAFDRERRERSQAAHAAMAAEAHEKFQKASPDERLEIVRAVFNAQAHAKRLRDFAEMLERLAAGGRLRADQHVFDLLESLSGRIGIMHSDAVEAFGLKGTVERHYAEIDAADTEETGRAAHGTTGPRG